MTTGTQKTALVTGATGGIGGAVAAALLRQGWHVRALTRRTMADRPASDHAGIEWIQGDAMNPADMKRAAEGVDILFHGANPPGYRNWRGLAIPMLQNAITAAKASGARLIYPGSVYPYGPDAWPVVDERAPQHPTTRKGRIRVEMEAMLAAEAKQGLRYLTVRAGDYFGPHAPSSWVSMIMLQGGKALRSIQTPERQGVRRAWAYLPDVAETIARLAQRERDLPAAETLHFGGHRLQDRQMAEAVARAEGHGLPVRAFPWALVYVAAPFNTTMRELLEMRYLWREEITLDNTRLRGILGEEPHTPLDQAVTATLAGLRAAKGG
ncbi:SDR family NAD(P)-dependent oxidoreductase [Acidisoma cellulosilytica]|uniref:SDR family NAD(P)-dependent oxidoreductase n=1 Tax=Acidisoma cellulosilyticum TaxID=2802395 RepID=A0A963Z5Z9_9PROT|nr:SDR family NAD(P)-dependent oxidoreductase [Acidisoma cellulosilyticum]MCB8882492.1 SDR family NAD(P)-dependent oxidoreductase [Acidisoma cellulosilyticum]